MALVALVWYISVNLQLWAAFVLDYVNSNQQTTCKGIAIRSPLQYCKGVKNPKKCQFFSFFLVCSDHINFFVHLYFDSSIKFDRIS